MDFWSLFDRLPCFPNCGCEPMIAGCFFCQPVNVITSIPYFLAGLILYFKVQNKNKELIAWVSVMGVVAATSMFAHSTYTRISMAMDYASIIFLFTFFLFFDLTKKYRALIVSPAYYILLTALLLPLDIWSQYYVSLVMFTIAVIHFLRKNGVKVLVHRSLLTSFTILGISTLFLLLDKDERLCSIKYIPYGHTIWHIGSALSSYFFGRWYFAEKAKH